MDPDEQEEHRKQVTAERARLAEIEKMKQTVQPFVRMAQAGGFGIDSAASEILLGAIRECLKGVNEVRADLQTIQEETKLGTSPYARRMTPFNRDLAAGVANSALTAVMGLSAMLKQAEAGVIEAKNHYDGTDDAGRQRHTRVDR
jgi:hypothetical protein